MIVLHNEEERAGYLMNPTINPSKIVVSNAPLGMPSARQWMVDNLVAEGEWLFNMDDNISGFSGLPLGFHDRDFVPARTDKNIYQLFKNHLTVHELLDIAQHMILRAETDGISYAGFSAFDNPYFREKHWMRSGLVVGKMTLIQRQRDLRFDTEHLHTLDDYQYTAENLLRRGQVLVNKFVFPLAKHYEKGGCGTYPEREQAKIKDCAYLMRKYPGLFRYHKKAGQHPHSELAFRLYSQQSINNWRKTMMGGK